MEILWYDNEEKPTTVRKENKTDGDLFMMARGHEKKYTFDISTEDLNYLQMHKNVKWMS